MFRNPGSQVPSEEWSVSLAGGFERRVAASDISTIGGWPLCVVPPCTLLGVHLFDFGRGRAQAIGISRCGLSGTSLIIRREIKPEKPMTTMLHGGMTDDRYAWRSQNFEFHREQPTLRDRRVEVHSGIPQIQQRPAKRESMKLRWRFNLLRFQSPVPS